MDFLIFKKMCLLRIGRRYILFNSDLWIYLLMISSLKKTQPQKISSNALLFLNLLEEINQLLVINIENNLVVKLEHQSISSLDTVQLLVDSMLIKCLVTGDSSLTKVSYNQILLNMFLNLLMKNNTIKGRATAASISSLIKMKMQNVVINHRFKYLGENTIAFLVHFINRINRFNSHVLTSIEKIIIDVILKNNSIKSIVLNTSIKDTFVLILKNIFKQSAFQNINANFNIHLNGNSNYTMIDSIPLKNKITILTTNNIIPFVKFVQNLILQEVLISTMTNVAILLHPAKIKDYFGIKLQQFFGKSIVDLKYKIEGEII